MPYCLDVDDFSFSVLFTGYGTRDHFCEDFGTPLERERKRKRERDRKRERKREGERERERETLIGNTVP